MRGLAMVRIALASFVFAACTTSSAGLELGGGGAGRSSGGAGGEGGAGAGEADDVAHPTAMTGVRYELEWDLAGATMDASGAGWSTVNDLGYRFTVTSASIVSYEASLVPCTVGGSGGAGGSGAADGAGGEGGVVFGPITLRFGPPSALANHAQEDDPSRVEAILSEDAASPAAVRLGARDLYATTYCHAHYLVAGEGAAPGEDDEELVPSLAITGTWSDAGHGATPFTVRVTSANGTLVPLPSLRDGARDGGIADVTIVRPLGTLFDAVDPEDGLDEEDQRRVLSNLVDGTRVELSF